MKNILLLDLDGTLVDLNPNPNDLKIIHKYIHDVADKFKISKIDNSAILTYKNILTSLGFGHSVTVDCRAFLNNYEASWATENALPLFGIDLFFEKVLRQFEKIYLITNNGLPCVEILFKKGVLQENWFNEIISRDNSSDIKPSAVPILKALDLAKSIKGKIYFIGDSSVDQKACVAANSMGLYNIHFFFVNSDCNLLSVVEEIEQNINS